MEGRRNEALEASNWKRSYAAASRAPIKLW